MVSNEQQSWLFHLGLQSSPSYLFSELSPTAAWQRVRPDILENFFRQSYLLTGLSFFQLLVQRLAQAWQVRAVYVVAATEENRLRTLAFSLDNQLVGDVAYDWETAPCADVIEGGELRYAEGVTAVYPAYCAQLGLHTDYYLGIPLTSTSGQLLGHVVVLHDAPFQLTVSHWPMWSLVLARAAMELERWQTAVQQTNTLHDLERRGEQLAALYEAALELAPSPAWSELIQVIAERIGTLLNCAPQNLLLELYLADPITNRFQLQQRHPDTGRPVYLCDPPTPELRHYVAQTGEAHITCAQPQNSMVYLLPDEARTIHIIRSSVLLPLLAGKRCIGLLYVGIRDRLSLTPDQVGSLMAFSDMLADLLRRINHVRELQDKLSQSQKQLVDVEARCQALDQLRAKLIHDVTQELFTPITSVRLYLDLLAYCRLDQNAQRYVEILRAKTQQLIHFAEDALHLSRLEQPAAKAHVQPVVLEDTLSPMIALYAQLAHKAGLAFTFGVGVKRPFVMGEPNQIRQAVAVLLDNAIAYTPAGCITVRLLANEAKTQLCVQVEDTGPGIEASELPYLFDRFYRGKQTQAQRIPGRGLGLTIALDIARLHGGRLEVESDVGKGSVFRLWLPFAAEDDMTTLLATLAS